MSRTCGFTLIELMVTVAVAAIVVTVAVPSFQAMIESNALTSQINQFVSGLNIARSEAVKRGRRVTLCRSTNGSSCVTTNDYAQGWIVFVDDDTNPGVLNSGDELLRVSGALKPGHSLRTNSTANYISYYPSGGANLNATFVLCKDAQPKKSRAVVMINTGRVQLAQDKNGNGIPENSSGDVSCTP